MQIEVGKRYVRRDGSVSGVLVPCGDISFPFHDEGLCATYTKDGIRGLGDNHWSDLVAEYVEPVFPSEVSGKEDKVEYDLSGIPKGYEFVGYRKLKEGDQYLTYGTDKIGVAGRGDEHAVRIVVKPTEPKQRTVAIHKWLVWDTAGKERLVFGTEEYVGNCGFAGVQDIGLYGEVKVNV